MKSFSSKIRIYHFYLSIQRELFRTNQTSTFMVFNNFKLNQHENYQAISNDESISRIQTNKSNSSIQVPNFTFQYIIQYLRQAS